MLVRLAWRNIWRNKRRTLITLLALSLGVTAIVTLDSFREVANQEMIRGLTRGLVGHVQIHGRGYQRSPEISNVVADAPKVKQEVLGAVHGARVEERVVGAGLAGTENSSSPVTVMGIEPENPGARALLTIEKGRTVSASPLPEVVVGRGLAAQFGLKPGSELVLVGQAADGSLANDRFTVVGTADAGSYEADASTVFLELREAQSFFALGNGVHELIVRLPVDDDENLSKPVSEIRSALHDSSLEVLPWTKILPELKGAIDAKRKNQRLVDVVVFLIVALGVLNTMTMSTFERTREFGVLASLGTRRERILRLVVLEALLQGTIGLLIGVAVALALLHGIGTIDLGALGGGGDVMGARLQSVLRLRLHPAALMPAAITTLVTVLAGGLIPAVRASRLKPIEATRYV